MKREFYRIITPSPFSNLNFETLEEAQKNYWILVQNQTRDFIGIGKK